jgi:hypothetical protein
MEQSPQPSKIRLLSRQLIAGLALLGMGSLGMQPSNLTPRAEKQIEQYTDRHVPQDPIEAMKREEPHNDRYGVRKPLVPQDILFENPEEYDLRSIVF